MLLVLSAFAAPVAAQAPHRSTIWELVSALADKPLSVGRIEQLLRVKLTEAYADPAHPRHDYEAADVSTSDTTIEQVDFRDFPRGRLLVLTLSGDCVPVAKIERKLRWSFPAPNQTDGATGYYRSATTRGAKISFESLDRNRKCVSEFVIRQ